MRQDRFIPLGMCRILMSLQFIVAIAICFAATCAAQEEIDDRIQEIQRKVTRELQQLKQLQGEQKALKAELSKAEVTIADLRSQEGELAQQLDEIAAGVAKVDAAISKVHKRQNELKELSARRLRVIYMASSSNTLDTMVFRGDSADFSRNAYFAGRIRRHDERILNEYFSLLDQERLHKKKLTQFQSQQKKVQESIRASRQEQEKANSLRKSTLSKLKKREPQVAARVTELRAQALRLETVVASITGGPTETPRSPREESSPRSKTVRSQAAFEGGGLSGLKNSLSAPVQGELIKKFGKIKHKEFKDFLFHKGLEYQASAGAPIRAVAEGKVLHRGRMPGYGTILIVDHGKRFYSLYGKLDQTLVEKGQHVNAGAEIATCSDTGEEAGRVYFEIRKEGRPVNPLDYLR